MRRLHPLAEAPTWVSPQGFAGALDHIFLRTPSEAAHTTEVRYDSGFPSDHLPVTATLHDLPPAPQLVCPSKKGRFPIPREPLASQLRTLNDTFRAELTPPPPGAPSAQPRYTEVTSALYTAATAAFGRPVPSQPVLYASTSPTFGATPSPTRIGRPSRRILLRSPASKSKSGRPGMSSFWRKM